MLLGAPGRALPSSLRASNAHWHRRCRPPRRPQARGGAQSIEGVTRQRSWSVTQGSGMSARGAARAGRTTEAETRTQRAGAARAAGGARNPTELVSRALAAARSRPASHLDHPVGGRRKNWVVREAFRVLKDEQVLAPDRHPGCSLASRVLRLRKYVAMRGSSFRPCAPACASASGTSGSSMKP